MLSYSTADMPDDQISKFVHRPNVDGTFDSVCRLSYSTIVRSERESRIDAHEQTHACDAVAFKDREAARRRLEQR